jgi:hypothetical protein
MRADCVVQSIYLFSIWLSDVLLIVYFVATKARPGAQIQHRNIRLYAPLVSLAEVLAAPLRLQASVCRIHADTPCKVSYAIGAVCIYLTCRVYIQARFQATPHLCTPWVSYRTGGAFAHGRGRLLACQHPFVVGVLQGHADTFRTRSQSPPPPPTHTRTHSDPYTTSLT